MPEVGTANAGVAARAEDASIAASNPPGMARLEKAEVMVTIQPIITDLKFQPGAGTTTTGPDGDGGVVLPAAGLFYVQPLGKDWRFGVSLGTYMGLGAKYEDDWVGRYYVQESALITLDLVPSLSYRVNDWLSIEAGLMLQYAYLKNTLALSTTANAQYDDTFHVAVGAHYRFHPKWRATAGFAYDSSPVGDADRTVSLPLDRNFRYSAGLIYDVTQRITTGLAYTFIDAGSASVNQTRGPLSGTIQGDYSSNYIHVVALNFAMRF